MFATSIEHADNLSAAFKAAGVCADYIHSEVEDPSEVLSRFRNENELRVLVSVGTSDITYLRTDQGWLYLCASRDVPV